jgi:hypothetical protein
MSIGVTLGLGSELYCTTSTTDLLLLFRQICLDLLYALQRAMCFQFILPSRVQKSVTRVAITMHSSHQK